MCLSGKVASILTIVNHFSGACTLFFHFNVIFVCLQFFNGLFVLFAQLKDFDIVWYVCVGGGCLFQIPGVVKLNTECCAEAVFNNPVDLTLTNCTMTFCGSGLVKKEHVQR